MSEDCNISMICFCSHMLENSLRFYNHLLEPIAIILAKANSSLSMQEHWTTLHTIKSPDFLPLTLLQDKLSEKVFSGAPRTLASSMIHSTRSNTKFNLAIIAL